MHRFLLASALLLAACSSTTTTASNPSAGETETPAEETPADDTSSTEALVAFTDSELQSVFDKKCVRCHAGTATPMDLRQFESTTINVPASTSSAEAECSDSKTPTRIVPGDRDASLLWRKVNGTQDCGDPMPPPFRGTKLTATELERLGLYIDGLSPE